MAKKVVSRVSALHRYEGKEFRVKRGQELNELPKALVTKITDAGLTMEVESNEDSNTQSSEK